MDLTKLTPAPWAYKFSEDCKCPHSVVGPSSCDGSATSVLHTPWDTPGTADDLRFCCLARNAFDVMMRRGWTASTDGVGRGWYVSNRDMMTAIHHDKVPEPKRIWPDPFTALVEANRWYSEHVERKETNG